MTRTVRIVVVASLAAFLLAGPLPAQDVKLRPLRPIYIDSLGAAISAPEGVAFDGSTRLVVADTGNKRFLLFDVSKDSFSPVAEFSLTQVPVPVLVRLGADGEILALDGKSHRIARIGQDRKFIGYMEPEPAAGLRSVLVKSFDVHDGNLYILDVSGSRIAVLDGTGGLRRTIDFSSEVEFLSDLTVNDSGTVFAIDSIGRKVFVARPGDKTLTPLTDSMAEDMAFPTAIEADDAGYLYISDRSGAGIVVVGENGSFHGRHSSKGLKQGFLRYPSGLDAGDEYLFVADRGNNRIQIFAISR